MGVWTGSVWNSDLQVKVKATGDGVHQPNEDGIMAGYLVCATTLHSNSGRYSEGERGRVVGMLDRKTAKVEFEGRSSESVPVATRCLHRLPENLSHEWMKSLCTNL